ncbi:hypothetical protein TNIN_289021 [Trichonephila inaurata madagascariensis]|uniref:Uncharacterized protein n=1 Tax=Trichonephila inaurata madagascariensis TaxID=2747483 RepID=A0A8X7CHE6_9ARAC|nr:hypothetical protein TNIN_289021 [Trichonephila inaurata madagascariensis]
MSNIIQDKNQDSSSELGSEETQPECKGEEYDPIAAIKEDLVSTAADKVEEQKKEQDGQKSLDESKAPGTEGKDSPKMKDSQSGKDTGSSPEEKGSVSESKDADKETESKKKDSELSSEGKNSDKNLMTKKRILNHHLKEKTQFQHHKIKMKKKSVHQRRKGLVLKTQVLFRNIQKSTKTKDQKISFISSKNTPSRKKARM